MADLDNADLDNADLDNADLENADLKNADGDGGMLSQSDLDALIAAASEGLPDGDSVLDGMDYDAPKEAPMPDPSPSIGMVDLPSFDAPALGARGEPDRGGGLGRVRDIPLEVTVELGRTQLLIRDIMDLSAGSIIELDKIAGEPVDLFANGLLVARGEVIVIDDNFGVRVTEIITAAERKGEKEIHALAA